MGATLPPDKGKSNRKRANRTVRQPPLMAYVSHSDRPKSNRSVVCTDIHHSELFSTWLAIRRDCLRAAQKPGNPLAGFACGIGIAHGRAIAGRLGTAEQFKVGVFGPVVNLAARLESMTKFFGVPILMDDVCAELS